MNKKQNKIISVKHIMLILYTSFLIIHLLLSTSTSTPLLYPDEAGYIGKARFFSKGYIETKYFPGYSILLTPLFLINNNIEITYKLIQFLNGFIMSFIPLLVYKIMEIFHNDIFLRDKIIITAVICCYPSFLLYSNLALSEALFITLYLLLVIQIYYLSINPEKILYWITTFACTSYLILTHPKGFAIFPVLIMIYIILFRKLFKVGKLNKKTKNIITGIFLFLIVIIISGIYFFQKGMNSYHIGKRINPLLSIEGFIYLTLSSSGKLFYLYIATGGFILTGLFYCFYILRTDKSFDGKYITILFMILSFASSLMVSSVFMLKPGHRADYIIYGRYTEGVIIPIFLMGITAYMNKKDNILTALSGIILISIVYLTRFKYLEGIDTNYFNILGVSTVRIYSEKLSFYMILAIFFILAAIIYITGKFNRKTVIYILGIYFLGTTFLINHYLFGEHSKTSILSEKSIIFGVKEYFKISKNNILYYDKNYESWNYYNTRVYLPDIQFKPFLLGETLYSDLFISGKDGINYNGARIAGITKEQEYIQENDNDIYLWILPGANQEYFINKGFVLPAGYPCKLPDETYNYNIKVSLNYNYKYEINKDIKIPVMIKHMGKGSFWPRRYNSSKNAGYEICSGIVIIGENTTLFTTDNLTLSVYPGQEMNMELTLPIKRFNKIKKMQEGKYYVRIDLLQPYVRWFSMPGNDMGLTVSMEIKNNRVKFSPLNSNDFLNIYYNDMENVRKQVNQAE